MNEDAPELTTEPLTTSDAPPTAARPDDNPGNRGNASTAYRRALGAARSQHLAHVWRELADNASGQSEQCNVHPHLA